MRGIKFYRIATILLLLLNIGLISFLVFAKPPHPPKPGDEPRLASEIGMSGELKQEIDALEIAHHKEKRKLMKESGDLHKELFNSIGSNENPENLLKKINSNQQEIESMTFHFFNEIAAKCDDKQLDELHKFIEKGLLRIGRGPHPRP